MTYNHSNVVLDYFDSDLGAWTNGLPRTAEDLHNWQLNRAWRLAVELAKDNPFYSRKVTIPAGASAEALSTLPLTRKRDVVDDCDQYPPFGSRTVIDDEDIRMIVQTSGTSGRGRGVYALDSADEDSITRIEATGFLWAGVRPGTRVLLTVPVGITAAGQWYYAALRFIGANVLPVGSYPTSRKVELVDAFEPEFVVGTPSYVQHLAMACAEAGIDPASSSVRSLMVAGEPYSLEWATRLEHRWGATLYEQYGCTERAIAWTCPGGVIRSGRLGVLHFPAESGYYEVLDPASGNRVADGEEGELVVTPFGADRSPLLRYATGDRVRYVAPGACDCGRPLGGIAAGSVTRFDDMMKVRGVNVWPATFDDAIFSVDGVTDYRGRVATDEAGAEVVEIWIETRSDSLSELSDEVRASVKRVTGLNSVVSLQPHDIFAGSIPEGFVKLKRWTDERGVR
ncbi:MAG: AMP-binding protein [Acidimicrobiia bacterium]|nr:AMP-binding protein [Acidimicrobiia bacterium]